MTAQPIDPEILPRLHPEYVRFYNAHVVHYPPLHTIPWNPRFRQWNAFGSAPVVPVASIKDYELSECKVRVFTPEGTAPKGGWPVYCWIHGGGWVLGNMETDNGFCSRACRGAKCVVVSVNYRLAPEHPYPAAVQDCLEAVRWVSDQGPSLLGINPARIALGGASAGGNLAAIISMKAAQLSSPIVFVLAQLIVPVTDNTAQPTGKPYASWKVYANMERLDADRMLWFRDCYLPDEADRTQWKSSPIFAPDDLLAKSPPTWVAVMELDVLRDEGLAYADKLKKVGVPVTSKMYMRAPHRTMSIDGVFTIGRELVNDMIGNLAEALGTL